MAGHSHWSSIKHKKAVVDSRRGRMFSKLAKNIMVAARSGGGNPADNLNLRYAIEKARAEFMPKESIERAVKKGTGELEGGELVELTYEGIGPGGVSFVAELVTDNRNRSSSELRNLIEKRGGNLGSVTWKFDRKGVLELPVTAIPEDELFEVVTEAGAEDLEVEEGVYRVTTTPEDLQSVRERIQQAVDEKQPKSEKAWGEEEEPAALFSRHEVVWMPQSLVPLDEETARKALDLLTALEEHDDVQNVYSDFDVPEELLQGD